MGKALLNRAIAMAKIQYTTPEGATGEVELTAERITLGRADDNVIVIDDASISSHHGELSFDGAAWVLTDLDSTNGTKVGGERISQVQLQHGAVFTVGNVECVFVGDQVEAPRVSSHQSYFEQPQSSAPGATGTFGDTPIDRSRRQGFGPRAKEKSGNVGLVALGVLALLVCGAAIYMFTQMTA